jgi:hypothetical protein
MSSSITGEYDSWDISNMMFWRVMAFASEVGQEMAQSPEEKKWVARLSALEDEDVTYSPDLFVSDQFPDEEECGFWAKVLFRLTDLIYERQIGNQEDQGWQVGTIWAAYDLARLMSNEARLRSTAPEI